MKEFSQIDADADVEKKALDRTSTDEMSESDNSIDSGPIASVDYSVEDVPPLPTAIFLGLQVGGVSSKLNPDVYCRRQILLEQANFRVTAQKHDTMKPFSALPDDDGCHRSTTILALPSTVH